MTLFVFRGEKSHEWTFCDPIIVRFVNVTYHTSKVFLSPEPRNKNRSRFWGSTDSKGEDRKNRAIVKSVDNVS